MRRLLLSSVVLGGLAITGGQANAMPGTTPSSEGISLTNSIIENSGVQTVQYWHEDGRREEWRHREEERRREEWRHRHWECERWGRCY